jgi:hypothetical protein
MMHAKPHRRWQMVSVVLAVLLVPQPGCSMKEVRNVPPFPEAVRTGLAEAEAAFAMAKDAPVPFRKAAATALPKLRRALDTWANAAEGIDIRNRIRGWMIEAGLVETAVDALPERPTSEECRSALASWRDFRSQLP